MIAQVLAEGRGPALRGAEDDEDSVAGTRVASLLPASARPGGAIGAHGGDERPCPARPSSACMTASEASTPRRHADGHDADATEGRPDTGGLRSPATRPGGPPRAPRRSRARTARARPRSKATCEVHPDAGRRARGHPHGHAGLAPERRGPRSHGRRPAAAREPALEPRSDARPTARPAARGRRRAPRQAPRAPRPPGAPPHPCDALPRRPPRARGGRRRALPAHAPAGGLAAGADGPRLRGRRAPRRAPGDPPAADPIRRHRRAGAHRAARLLAHRGAVAGPPVGEGPPRREAALAAGPPLRPVDVHRRARVARDLGRRDRQRLLRRPPDGPRLPAHVRPRLYARKGTADNWTAEEQMLAAEKALPGRGFTPWPNTARMCGLL